MSIKMAPLGLNSVLPSSPSNVMRLCELSFSVDSSCFRNDAVRFLTQTSNVVVQLPTMVLSETFRLSLFLVIRGGIGFLERLGARGTRPNGVLDTHPRTRASGNPTGHYPR